MYLQTSILIDSDKLYTNPSANDGMLNDIKIGEVPFLAPPTNLLYGSEHVLSSFVTRSALRPFSSTFKCIIAFIHIMVITL